MAEQRNPNHILGVPVGANKATIEAAYRRLARRYHPDLNVDPDATTQMQDINWARDVLLDPHKRYHWAHHAQSDRRPYTHYTHSYTTRARTETRARPRQADRDDQEWGKPYTSEQERYWERTRVKSPLFDDVPFGSPLQGCVLDQRTVWGMVALLGFVLIYYVAEALFGPAPHNSQPAFALPSGMAGFVIETATQREQVQAVLDYAARKSPPAVTVESGGRVIWYTRDETTGYYCPPDIDNLIERELHRCERYAVPFKPDFVITPAPTATESVPLLIGKS